MVVRLHADDLGLHPSVDRAVFRLFEAGAIEGASILVTGCTFRQASRKARGLGMPVSLHLALVDTKPISAPSDVPTLLGAGGRFPPYFGTVVWRSLRGTMNRVELRLEIERQIQEFCEAGLVTRNGLTVDGHQHLHLLPDVFEYLLQFAPRFGLTAFRLPLRSPYERRKLRPRSFAFAMAEVLGERARNRARLDQNRSLTRTQQRVSPHAQASRRGS